MYDDDNDDYDDNDDAPYKTIHVVGGMAHTITGPLPATAHVAGGLK